MEEDDLNRKGKVCVTGGTGFVGSWLIMRLLQLGYSVNATIRSSPSGRERDISYLTDLPGASEKLRIFTADLERPDSFRDAIEGCIGVFHVAHPIEFAGSVTEELVTWRTIQGTLGILQACIDSKTVKRVVYTSSAAAVMFQNNGLDVLDESSWSDVNYIRSSKAFGAAYLISKMLTEKAAIEFAEKHSLDLVTVIPTFVHGPFITPSCPSSVKASLVMIIGDTGQFRIPKVTPFVHIDDVASAHIYLFEYPEAKGRYICCAVEIKTDKLYEFVSNRYPEYGTLSTEWITDEAGKLARLSSKKLLDTGFSYKYGAEEMFDGAIECCKQKGFL